MGRLFIAVALASVLVLAMGTPGRGQWSSSSSSQAEHVRQPIRRLGLEPASPAPACRRTPRAAPDPGRPDAKQLAAILFRHQVPASTRQVGNFVGSDRQDLQALFGAMNATGQQRQRQRQRPFARRDRSNNRGANQANRGNNGVGQGGSAATELRTSLRVGFEPPRPVPSRVATTLTDRLARSTRIHVVGPVTVDVREDTTILRGEVATSHDRMLAEQLALLEPGVRRVKNELVVTGESTTPAATDPPAAEESKTPPTAAPPAPGE